MKRLLAVVLALMVFTVPAVFAEEAKPDLPDASQDKQVVIIYGGVTSASMGEMEEMWIKMVEELSGGSIKIEHHPDNELADDRTAIELTAFGDMGIGSSSTSPLATMYADFNVFDAPYLFSTPEQAWAALDGPVGTSIYEGIEELGLKGLMWCENGFRNLTTKDKLVKSPSDLSNMKLRTMENKLQMAAWSALGANPTPMAFAELFTAMQQGTVVGQENPLGIIDANSFMDVQGYVMMTRHIYTPYVVLMNLEMYNNELSDAQRAVIDYVSDYCEKWQRTRSQEIEGEILKKFEENKINVIRLTPEELAAFKQKLIDDKIYDQVKAAMIHPEYIDMLLAANQ